MVNIQPQLLGKKLKIKYICIMKTTLDEILEHYEKKEETKSVSVDTVMSEADYELWEYLCGDGYIRTLYNYYDLVELNQSN